MKEIMNLINEWDPVKLFPMAPKDEYIYEVKKIESCLNNNNTLDTKKFAKMINDIFRESFGNDVYNVNMNDCVTIAQKILDVHKNSKIQT